VEPIHERIVDILQDGSNSIIKPHLINWGQVEAVSNSLLSG